MLDAEADVVEEVDAKTEAVLESLSRFQNHCVCFCEFCMTCCMPGPVRVIIQCTIVRT